LGVPVRHPTSIDGVKTCLLQQLSILPGCGIE
jgi:hypothetical protein